MSAAEPSIADGARPRLASVDVLRGVIMVLMALDHTRDFFGDLAASPTDLATTTPALFMTRWVTHFCAPVFFLLTGTGAYLARRRRTPAALARYLITRGLWLLLLETVLLRVLGWQWNADFKVTILTTLWGLGWAMIVLGALVRWVPVAALTAIGVAMIAGHNALDGIAPDGFGVWAPLWTALHVPGFLYNAEGMTVLAAYPLIPWIGVTMAGYGLGVVFDWEAARRRTFLLRTGLTAILLFLVLRGTNLYGDPAPWSAQAEPVMTVVSFLNLNKYPPSLLFLLMTLGPACLALRALDGGTPHWLAPAHVFGRVPMFYYIAHVVLLHALTAVALAVRFGDIAPAFRSDDLSQFPFAQPAGWPAPLPVVWLIWIGVVVLLYPACRWFAGVKQRRSEAWLSYL